MYNHLKHPTAISFFHRKLTLFVILENTNKTCILLLFYNSFDFLNVVLINMITILIISANLLLLAPLKQSYFEIMVMTSQFLSMTSSTKFYHINQIISQIWSCNQSLLTLALLSGKFITSILRGFNQKKRCFGSVVLIHAQ